MDIMQKKFSIEHIFTERPATWTQDEWRAYQKQLNKHTRWYRSNKIQATDKINLKNG